VAPVQPNKTQLASPNLYDRLGVSPNASQLEIRRSYRELSKQYHPDTTSLPIDSARDKFQQLTEAYATLADPLRRALYDRSLHSYQPLPRPVTNPAKKSSAYIDATDRPLSAGEISVLLFLALTIGGCLVLAITMGLAKDGKVLDMIGYGSLIAKLLAR